MGIYAIVELGDKITAAKSVANSKLTADQALTNYFSSVLANPAVSGLLVIVKWKDLEETEGTYLFNYLDDAFNAIDDWNAANPSAPPKTLQLVVAPGFNSPDWLFKDIDAAIGRFARQRFVRRPVRGTRTAGVAFMRVHQDLPGN